MKGMPFDEVMDMLKVAKTTQEKKVAHLSIVPQQKPADREPIVANLFPDQSGRLARPMPASAPQQHVRSNYYPDGPAGNYQGL
jgi:hypothetical protein